MCNTAIDYAFHTLKLHRIMANYMAYNLGSEKLLNRLGFCKRRVGA
ncbi:MULTISPECIES: GNAT family N-acetyltransferase [unclassified Pseudoalteromonas]